MIIHRTLGRRVAHLPELAALHAKFHLGEVLVRQPNSWRLVMAKPFGSFEILAGDHIDDASCSISGEFNSAEYGTT